MKGMGGMKEVDGKSSRIKINWKALEIKGKKDWVIFWILTALVCYCLGHPVSHKINAWLREMGNPWLREINEPQPYGRMIAATLILALMAEVVLFLCRKPLKAKMAVLAAGILAPLLLAGIYQVNCRLITSVFWEETPRCGYLFYAEEGERISVPLSPEECLEFQELARNMTIVSDKARRDKFMEWYCQGTSDACMGADKVSLYFPEKYGHDYVLEIWCKDGYVYLWRGHGRGQTDLVTLFEDNGVMQWMEQRKQQSHS